jgi:hypothetical protein
MLRFAKNRWWTFILALSLLFACGATLPSGVFADGGAIVTSDPAPGGGAGTGIGDPDNPTGKSLSHRGRMQAGNSTYRSRTVGDGSASGSVWMLRLQAVLQALRWMTVRF